MSDPVPAVSAEATPPPATALFPDNSAQVAQQAEAQGQNRAVRERLQTEIERERSINRLNGARQFEQAVVWRRLNIGLGLTVGLLVAASGATALFSHLPAAIIGLFATFGTGALTTLNAGHRKAQSLAAGCSYREIESAARELLEIELPFIPLADAIKRSRQLTVRRMQINRTAEPPSARALRRADRAVTERERYGRRLSSAERTRLVFWVPRPKEIQAVVEPDEPQE